jgi:hypothetical protein
VQAGYHISRRARQKAFCVSARAELKRCKEQLAKQVTPMGWQ